MNTSTPDKARALATLTTKRLREQCAEIRFLQGAAEVLDPLCAAPHEAVVGARLATGVSLRVTQGRALVRFDDGSDLWIAEGSSLELSAWSERVRSARLLVGKLFAFVAPDARRPFAIGTAHGEAAVLGTAFELITDADHASVSVYHGCVELRTDLGRVQARAQHSAFTRGGGAPLSSRMERPAMPGWLGTAEATAANPSVASAWNAVRATGDRSRSKGPIIMNRVLISAVLLALVAGGIYFGMRSSDTSTPPVAASSGGAVASAPPADAMPEKESVILMNRDGKKLLEFDPSDPGSLEDALDGMNRDDAAVLRKLLQFENGRFKPAGADVLNDADRARLNALGGLRIEAKSSRGSGGPPAVGQEEFDRQVQASLDALRQLLDSGMDPAQAKAQAEAALTDSYRKLIGEGEVKVNLDMNRDSGQTSVGIEIRKGTP